MANSLKKCSSCSNELPKTQENFYVRDKAKGALRNECINCFKKKKGRKNKKLAIYRITSPSGKVYIGKDQYFPNRMVNHFHISENKKKTEHNSPIHKAIRKYGWEDMIVEAVDFNAKTTDELSHREEIWIWLCNSHKRGYNQTKGGEGTKGFRHSDETKERISKLNTGRKKTPEQLEVHRLASTGRKHKEESKLKIGLGNKGKVLSESTRELISKARSGTPLSEDHKKSISKGLDPYKGVPIPEERRIRIKESHLNSKFELIDPKGKIYVVTDLKTFADDHNLTTQHLYKVFLGKRKHHKGWKGKYLLKQGEDFEAPFYEEKIKQYEKKVALISDDGEVLGEWFTISECAKSLTNDLKKKHNLERSIAKVLRGERKKTNGMLFKFIDNNSFK